MDFCEKHSSFVPEKIILSFIDFVEDNFNNVVPCLDSSLATQILDQLKILDNKVQGIDTTLNVKQTEYFNKSNEMKKEYIDDIRNMLSLNNTEKIVPIIKEYNETFINKLSLLFKEIIPNEQQTQTIQLQNILKNIEQTVVIEMNKGINQNSIESMLSSIEQKFANILTHSEQKLGSVLSAVNDNKKEEQLVHNKIDQMLSKLNNNSKGKISENLLNFNLQAIYPTAEILNKANTPHAGDFWIIRKDKPDILVENKNYDYRVYATEVQKFIDNINTQNMSGIMISQKTTIVHRENYEIEIHNGNVAVYIHECNYDPYKIKIAVQIIDTFKQKIEKQKIENGTIVTIDKECLEQINNEFQRFIIKKSQHMSEIKNMYDTLIKSAEEMEMESLENLLESQGLLTNVKKFICSNCPRTFKTQKGLDTHERQCIEIKTKKEWKCKQCDEIKPTHKGLRTHCIKKHKVDIGEKISDTDSECSEN
jgi:hypothetical protein